mmetsp:Transcript_9018/g.30566  ORF Transcript_9018/g.30566 Transcript_9018/m.30566 type:complete len:578 (+) Transcript_9018:341-2074(+)
MQGRSGAASPGRAAQDVAAPATRRLFAVGLGPRRRGRARAAGRRGPLDSLRRTRAPAGASARGGTRLMDAAGPRAPGARVLRPAGSVGAGVELLEDLLRDALEELLGEGPEEAPGEVEGVEDGAVLVGPLRNELLLELVEELEVEVVLGRERLLADDGLHGHHVLADGVVCIELVGHVAVVAARHVRANGRLHQAREGREHVDRRVDLAVVQLAVHVDLPLGDVAREVRDGVRDVVVGHGEDGDLRDGARAALHAPGALVDGREVRVHVAGVPAAAGHLLASRGHLAEGVGVRGHVREDHEHVLVAVVGQVLGRGERNARGDDALDGGVVGQVEEEGHALHGAVLLEVVLEEARRLHVDAHGREHNGERLLRVIARGRLLRLLDEARLAADLGRDVVVRETGRREERDLLPAGDGVHAVDGGDARLDHLLGVGAHLRVDGLAVDVEVVLGEHARALVDGLAGAVEGAAEHVLGHGRLEHLPGEGHGGALVVDAGGALEHLHDGLVARHLEALARALGAVGEGELDDLSEGRVPDVVEDDEGPVHALHRAVGEAGLHDVVTRRGVHVCLGHICRVILG